MLMWIKNIIIGTLLLVGGFLLIALGVLIYQGRQEPQQNGEYVALGSSFAAGLGLGQRAPGSPLVCQRSINGYPQQLARMQGLSLVDMTCSGATIKHVQAGGQLFLGPQINAIGPETRLVTLTAGGNDVGYVGDLTMMAYRQRGGFVGFLLESLWKGTKPIEERIFSQLKSEMTNTLNDIIRLAPKAKIVLVMYPSILPMTGTCAPLGIDEKEATLMREVANRFAEVQRAAALDAGVLVVDMEVLSIGHDVCSSDPWVNGAAPVDGVLFHPTHAGAEATAKQINFILKAHP